MTPTFNLIDEPWIPCLDLVGNRRELSLRQVLVEAHLLREIMGESPPVTVALHRLLLAILLRCYGLQQDDAWETLWRAGALPDGPLQRYFEQWHARFDLFDAHRPFMQATDARVKPKGIATLMLDIASGNNATLFDHHIDADGMGVIPSVAARALITAQMFGLPGRSSFSKQNHTSGVCVGGVIFVLEGNNLFETLMLNCFYPDNRLIVSGSQDRPAWEMDNPLLPNRTVPHGYLDYLTWHNRLVLLMPEVSTGGIEVRLVTVGPGLQLDPLPLDPMKSYRPSKEHGYIAIAFSADRAIWRDSTVLFRFHNSSYRPPQALDSLAYLIGELDKNVLDRYQTRRIMALGMSSNQARVDFFRAERMPLLLNYLRSEPLVERLIQALEIAEAVWQQLRRAAQTLATFLIAPNQQVGAKNRVQREDLEQLMGGWDIQRPYWSRLEVSYFQLMEELNEELNTGEETALIKWFTLLRRTAHASLERVISMMENGPRGYKAAVHARQQLASGLAKALPVSEVVASGMGK